MKQLSKRAFGTAMWIAEPQDRYLKTELLRPLPSPIGPLDFRVVARKNGSDYTELTEPIILKMTPKPDGYFPHFGLARTPSGSFRRGLLESGDYAIRVTSPLHFYQDADINKVSLGHDSGKPEVRVINLMPGFAYPFPAGGRGPTLLRGSFHYTDGLPIAGAVVKVDEAFCSYTTNASGQWVLVFPDDGLFPDDESTADVTVTVSLPGEDNPEVVTVNNVRIEKKSTSSLPETALQGRVVDAHRVGVVDVRVSVDGVEGSTKTDADGMWTYYFPLDQAATTTVSITATHPDGRTLTQADVEMEPRKTLPAPIFVFA